MQKISVSFINVGRDKKSWNSKLLSLTDRNLIQEIKRQKALMSSNIDFSWNETGDEATIFVGLFRNVGSLKVNDGFHV